MLHLRGFILQGWKAVIRMAESDLFHVGGAGLREGQCLLHVGSYPSLISIEKGITHYSAEKGGLLLSFRCQTNNWHLFFTVNIYSSTSEPLPAIRTSAWCTSCSNFTFTCDLRWGLWQNQEKSVHMLFSPWNAGKHSPFPMGFCSSFSPGCDAHCSIPDSHVCAHTQPQLLLNSTSSHISSLLQQGWFVFPEQNLWTCCKILTPISRKVPVYHTTMLTAKRYPQKMKSRIQMKGNTQQIKEAAYMFLTKLKINGHKQRTQGAMYGLFVCGISWLCIA